MAGEDRWQDPEAISDAGERVSHLTRDDLFDEHLSIYEFAASLCRGATVLDAGCGAGYGSAQLAEAGALRVDGVDASANAVEFSRHYFGRPKLDFRVMDLGLELDFPDDHFDFILASNVLEHLAGVPSFLRESTRVLRAGGRMLVAVPPVTSDELLYLNLMNPHHLNLWTPRQWEFALGQFFATVEPYVHRRGADGLEFELAPVETMYPDHTITAVFVAADALPVDGQPARGAPQRFVDDSLTREPGAIDPALRKRLSKYFERPSLGRRALEVAREDGFAGLAAAVRSRLSRRRRGSS